MRRRSLGLAVACILFVTGDLSATRADLSRPRQSDGRDKSHPIKGYEKFQAWARLVRAHEPGAWDDAARSIAAWPLNDLRSTMADLNALGELLAHARRGMKFVRYSEPRVDGRRPSGAEREMHLDQVPALLILADDGWSLNLGSAENPTGYAPPGGADFEAALRQLEREVTRFVKLAAMMHADIAMLSPSRGGLSALPEQDVPRSSVVMLRDGQAVGVGGTPVHWELGRAALDIVTPDPAGDAFVPLWYRATAAYQGSGRSYAYAKAHLAHAREVLPRDAYVQFYSGVLQENLTAPPVQVAVQALEASGRYRFNVLPLSEQLQQAETWLRRALDLESGLGEARVHLARVVGLLGHHDEAAGELRRALVSLTRDELRYDAELFLGGEEQALGHANEARAAFQRAQALCPRAQSPYLAQSQVAWQNEDSTRALAAFAELAKLPALETARPDPWWTYDVSAFADASRLLAELREAALKERSQ